MRTSIYKKMFHFVNFWNNLTYLDYSLIEKLNKNKLTTLAHSSSIFHKQHLKFLNTPETITNSYKILVFSNKNI